MSHKVIIELEFEPSNGESDEEMTVVNCDVYDYLEELIADGFKAEDIHEYSLEKDPFADSYDFSEG